MKQSPYTNNFHQRPLDKMYVDVFVTKPYSKKMHRLVFTDGEFERICDLLTELFPPRDDGGTFSFNVEEDGYELK